MEYRIRVLAYISHLKIKLADPLRLVLLLIFERPVDWKKQVETYMISVSKNSFYLFDTVNALRARYRYDIASEKELNEIRYLLKMGIAKQELGDKKPGLNKIKMISNRVLPKRD